MAVRRLGEGNLTRKSDGCSDLVDLLDLGACAAAAGGGAVLVHAAGHVGAGALVHLGDDGVADALELLHLVFKLVGLGELVAVEPLDGAVYGVLDLLLVGGGQLGADLLVFSRAFLASTFFLCSSSSDLYFSASWTIFSISSLLNVEDTVGVDVEADGDLRHAPGAGGMPDSSNLPSRLLSLVRVRSPSYTWMSTPGWLSEYVEKTCSFFVGIVVFLGISTVITPPAQQEVLHLLASLAAEDGRLHGGSVRHRLVGVDALAQFLPVEEILQELLHLGDSSGSAYQNHVALLHRLHALSEQVHVQLLEPGAGHQGPLRPLARRPQPPQSPGIPADVLLRETSKVPPPRSKIRTFFSPTLVAFLSRPYAMAAAVGSLMIRITFRPAITPASFVAYRRRTQIIVTSFGRPDLHQSRDRQT
ncbi:unnamed protein product [Spirodela intermedia]|uniref:Uncharacterized protein n=1 Tax=Spirodela intermedia TaxID=51605 RepID=A0A7I8IGB4_SPIIN|nr:unnamed protein product [Spirodela intermedia]CAA6656821.1 unnamed protein product [Spirodela intermedia]